MQLQKPEINCSICHKPVALETVKTDEVGQAVHEECYLVNLCVEVDDIGLSNVNGIEAAKRLCLRGGKFVGSGIERDEFSDTEKTYS